MSNPDLQSKCSRKKQNSMKTSRIAMAAVLLAFLAFAGFATFSVTDIATTVEDNILANTEGVPESWHSLAAQEKLETSVSSRVINNSYVEYTVKVKNTDSSHSANITHLASYVKDGEKDGFVSLANNSLEYSYSDSEAKSWNDSKISEPSNKDDGSKLENSIYVGKEGTATDTVYFRYIVSPSSDGEVSDKVSILTSTDAGKQEVITVSDNIEFVKPDATRIAAEEKVRENPTIAKADPNDESGEYAKPLGVESDPSSNVISTSSLGSIFLSPESFMGNTIIISVAIGVFTLSLVVYLFVRGRGKKTHKK